MATVSWEKAKLDAEILWLCVPDGEIARTAREIAARRGEMRGQVVLHSSGALTTDALQAVEAVGAAAGAVAPVFSFPTREPLALDGVIFMVEGGRSLSRRLHALVRMLGGKPIKISSEKKALYHAAATMASPLLVSALHAAVSGAEIAGLSSRQAAAVVEVLAAATLRNYFSKGAKASFSGAFARGDAGTVELHLQALAEHPILDSVYQALARHAVDSLPVKNAGELQRVLESTASGA